MEQHKKVQLQVCHIWSWMQLLWLLIWLAFKYRNIISIKASFHNMRGLWLLLSPERHTVSLNTSIQQLIIRLRWQISEKKPQLLFVQEYLTSLLCLFVCLFEPEAKNMLKKIKTSLVYLEKEVPSFSYHGWLGKGHWCWTAPNTPVRKSNPFL